MLKNQKNISMPKMLTQYFNQCILGNNDYIEYFGYTIKKLIVTVFYENLKLLYSFNQRINHLLKLNNIDYKKNKL